MTATQKYLFDLQGYLLVEDVLTGEQCETAKRKIRERMQPLAKTPDGYDANGTWHRCAGLIEAGEPFISLIDHPRLLEVLTEIIGPKLRLESAYSFVRSKGCPQFEMHGGHRGGRVNFRYAVQGDRIFTGLTVVSFALQEITAKDGGFACNSRLAQVRLPRTGPGPRPAVRRRRPAGAEHPRAQGIGHHLHRDPGPRRQPLDG